MTFIGSTILERFSLIHRRLVITVTGKVYESAWKEDNLPAELSIRLDAEKIIYKYHYLDFQNVNAYLIAITGATP